MSGDPAVHRIETAVHGRYLLQEPRQGPAQGLLVGFHGYGETALAHLQAIRGIPGSEGWLLCAIQALHPFYTRAGEVVASWMTREDRELAIADNLRYVTSVVERVRVRAPGRLVLAGFSQGVAMAYRAAAGLPRRAHGLLALAGDVPPDVEAGGLAELPPVLVGRGTADGWYDEAKMSRDLAVLEGAGVLVHTVVFSGGHEWSAEFYRAAGEFLRKVAATS